MMSLKAFAPVLASILGTTPAAVYERQRALVRAKVLPTPAGRGRGNGLPATAENVALMLMAIMATDNLSEFRWSGEKVGRRQSYYVHARECLRVHRGAYF